MHYCQMINTRSGLPIWVWGMDFEHAGMENFFCLGMGTDMDVSLYIFMCVFKMGKLQTNHTTT